MTTKNNGQGALTTPAPETFDKTLARIEAQTASEPTGEQLLAQLLKGNPAPSAPAPVRDVSGAVKAAARIFKPAVRQHAETAAAVVAYATTADQIPSAWTRTREDRLVVIARATLRLARLAGKPEAF